MVKQTNRVWLKKRTSRGRGRAVTRQPMFSWRNLDRELHKNQLIYAYKLLKLCLLCLIGLVWIGIDGHFRGARALPVGFVLGLIFVVVEHSRRLRVVESGLLIVSLALSWCLPIGFVL